MDANTIRLFGSKKTDDWQTPPDLYKKLDDEFHFDFDPCPLHSTFDGLKCNWGKRCFVNPPYSKVKEFLDKCRKEILLEHTELAVFLVFSNTDTNWFHTYCYGKAELRFIKGRLKFWSDGKEAESAMRPSMLVIFRRNNG